MINQVFLFLSFVYLSCSDLPEKRNVLLTSYIEPNMSKDKMAFAPKIHFGPYKLKHLHPVEGFSTSKLGAPYFQISDSVAINEREEEVKLTAPLKHLSFRETKTGLFPLDERTRFLFGVLSALDQVVEGFYETVSEFPLSLEPLPVIVHPWFYQGFQRTLIRSKISYTMRNNAAYLVSNPALLLFPSPESRYSPLEIGVSPSVLAHEIGHAVFDQSLPENVFSDVMKFRTSDHESFLFVHMVHQEFMADLVGYIVAATLNILPAISSRNPLLETRRLQDLITLYQTSQEQKTCSIYCLATLLFKSILLAFMESHENFDNQPQERGELFRLVKNILIPLTEKLIERSKSLPAQYEGEKPLDESGFPHHSLLLLGDSLSDMVDLWKDSGGFIERFCYHAKDVFNVAEAMGENFLKACPL
jgi:hypothetical protein